MAKVYVFFADGFEEVEALTTVDLLRRANVEVVMTSIMGKNTVTGAQGITVCTDKIFEEIDPSDADMLILPGGQPVRSAPRPTDREGGPHPALSSATPTAPSSAANSSSR